MFLLATFALVAIVAAFRYRMFAEARTAWVKFASGMRDSAIADRDGDPTGRPVPVPYDRRLRH